VVCLQAQGVACLLVREVVCLQAPVEVCPPVREVGSQRAQEADYREGQEADFPQALVEGCPADRAEDYRRDQVVAYPLAQYPITATYLLVRFILKN